MRTLLGIALVMMALQNLYGCHSPSISTWRGA